MVLRQIAFFHHASSLYSDFKTRVLLSAFSLFQCVEINVIAPGLNTAIKNTNFNPLKYNVFNISTFSLKHSAFFLFNFYFILCGQLIRAAMSAKSPGIKSKRMPNIQTPKCIRATAFRTLTSVFIIENKQIKCKSLKCTYTYHK